MTLKPCTSPFKDILCVQPGLCTLCPRGQGYSSLCQLNPSAPGTAPGARSGCTQRMPEWQNGLMNVGLSPSAGGLPDFSFVQLQYSAASKSDQMHVTCHMLRVHTRGFSPQTNKQTPTKCICKEHTLAFPLVIPGFTLR